MTSHISVLLLGVSLGLVSLAADSPETAVMVERLPVYSVVKPDSITTLLAVNHGFIAQIGVRVGQNVKQGEWIMTIMERETSRPYRSGIEGGVAKLHVTNGAAVTPGMPLITIMNPAKKQIEISLSPQEAQKLQVGSKVFRRGGNELFGKLSRISGLVDPETGAVLAYVDPDGPVENLIGDIVPIDIAIREIPDCKVIRLRDLASHMEEFTVEAISGDEVCLKKK